MANAIQKFMFDRSFDDPDEAAPPPSLDDDARAAPEGEDGEEAEAEPSPPPPPTFTEEEMVRAREEAFAEGRAAGLKEAEETALARVAETAEAVNGAMGSVFEAQRAANETIESQAVEVAVAVAAKLFPELNRKGGLGEVTAVVEETMRRLISEPRITVRVASELRDPLLERVEALGRHESLEGRVVVVADDTVPVGDCRIEWDQGGAERNAADLLSEIDGIIERDIRNAGDGPDAG